MRRSAAKGRFGDAGMVAMQDVVIARRVGYALLMDADRTRTIWQNPAKTWN